MAEILERATSSLTSAPSSVSPSANPSSSSSPSLTSPVYSRAGKAPLRVSPSQNKVSIPISLPTLSSPPPLPSLKSPNTPTPSVHTSCPPTISLVSDDGDDSHSSSSDVEILPPPLSTRIQQQQAKKTGHTLTLSSPSPPTHLLAAGGPRSHSRVCVEETPEHSGPKVLPPAAGSGSLTPAQMAGHAALHRLGNNSAGGGGGGRGKEKSGGSRGRGEYSWKEDNDGSKGTSSGKGKEKERRKRISPSWRSSGRVDLTLEKEDSPVCKKRRDTIEDDDDGLPDFPLLTKAAKSAHITPTHSPTLTSPPPKSPQFHTSPASPSPSLPKSTASRPVLHDVTSSKTHNPSSTVETVSKTPTEPPLFRLKPGLHLATLATFKRVSLSLFFS